ncbi:MAG: hypothetical protein KF802_15575 [Bdellovibrionaceae bacterium]|nr:hypothetical protein [Pseudobdellovibrionaceae bacterium]
MKKSTRLFLASGAALIAAVGAYLAISRQMHETLVELPFGLISEDGLVATPAMTPQEASRCQGVLQRISETTDCAQKLDLYRSNLAACQSAVDNSTFEDYNPRAGLDSEFTDRIFAISKCHEVAGRIDEAKKVFAGIQFPEDYFYITGGSGCPIDKFLPGYLAALDFPTGSCLKAEETKALLLKIVNDASQVPQWTRLVQRGQFVHFGTNDDVHLPCSGDRAELESAWKTLASTPGWVVAHERAPELDSPRPSLAYELISTDRRVAHAGFRLSYGCWTLSSLSIPLPTNSAAAPEAEGPTEMPGAPAGATSPTETPTAPSGETRGGP